MARRQSPRRGFTLVELMLVVTIVGVLAALATYGVRKYVSYAKTTEARSSLGELARDASSAYDRDTMSGGVLPLGTSTLRASNSLCATSTRVPSTIGSIQGHKYQSSPTEWTGTDIYTGWACLKFHMKDPQYYMYQYIATGTGDVGDSFQAIAQGDLNGDGVTSRFLLSGKIQGGHGGGVELTLAPNIDEISPDE